MRRIFVHIDCLALRGARYEDRRAIAAGIEAELRRALSDPKSAGALVSLDGAARWHAGTARIAVGSTPERMGAQIAHRIGRGLPR